MEKSSSSSSLNELDEMSTDEEPKPLINSPRSPKRSGSSRSSPRPPFKNPHYNFTIGIRNYIARCIMIENNTVSIATAKELLHYLIQVFPDCGESVDTTLLVKLDGAFERYLNKHSENDILEIGTLIGQIKYSFHIG